MDARALRIDKSKIPIFQVEERVKRARAKMLRQCGPTAFVYFHREIAIEHDDSQFCICDPVVIAQTDYRPSLYFANEILYPVMH